MVASLIRLLVLRSVLRRDGANPVQQHSEEDDNSEVYKPPVDKCHVKSLQAVRPPSRQTSHATSIKENRDSIYSGDPLSPETNRKKKVRLIFTHIGLFLSLLIYALLGAAIFQAFEQSHEETSMLTLRSNKEKLIAKIKLLNTSDSDYDTELTRLLTEHEDELSVAVNHGVDVTKISSDVFNTSAKWDFFGSLFFAGTVFTTIGYGHIAPVTTGGRIATMIYAVFGIPLCLIVLSDIGGLFSKGLKHLLVKCINSCRQSSCNRNIESELTVNTLNSGPVLLVLFGAVFVYLFVIAGIYTAWETKWSYLDGFYFLFISITTIGFGDVLPDHPKYFLISFILIFLGLSLFSTIFTVFQELLHQTISKATHEIDNKLGIVSKGSDDAGSSVSDLKKSNHSEISKWTRHKGSMELSTNDEMTPV